MHRNHIPFGERAPYPPLRARQFLHHALEEVDRALAVALYNVGLVFDEVRPDILLEARADLFLSQSQAVKKFVTIWRFCSALL